MALDDAPVALDDAAVALDAPPLRSVDRAALARTGALAALCADLGATLAFGDWPDRAWLTGTSLACAVVTLDDAACPLHPERVEALAALIDRLTPAFDALESRITLPLEFDDCRTLPGVTSAVRIAFAQQRAVLDFVPLIDFAQPVRPRRLVPLPIAVVVEAARLSIDRAAQIAAGDLLVLSAGPWVATLGGGDHTYRGTLDPGDGCWREGGITNSQTGRPVTQEPPSAAGFGDLTVPVTMHLPDAAIPIDTYTAIGPGTVVELGAIVAGLGVELRVAGRVVASGELIRLGDRYAVIVAETPLPLADNAAVAEDAD